MESALGASVPLDEPSSFEDGERGTKEETLDMGVPSVEDDCIAMESSAYMKREVQDWISQFRHKEQLFIVEVMMGDKTVTQFCKDYRMSDVTAKKMRARIIEEGAESLSYVLYNLEKTP